MCAAARCGSGRRQRPATQTRARCPSHTRPHGPRAAGSARSGAASLHDTYDRHKLSERHRTTSCRQHSHSVPARHEQAIRVMERGFWEVACPPFLVQQGKVGLCDSATHTSCFPLQYILFPRLPWSHRQRGRRGQTSRPQTVTAARGRRPPSCTLTAAPRHLPVRFAAAATPATPSLPAAEACPRTEPRGSRSPPARMVRRCSCHSAQSHLNGARSVDQQSRRRGMRRAGRRDSAHARPSSHQRQCTRTRRLGGCPRRCPGVQGKADE